MDFTPQQEAYHANGQNSPPAFPEDTESDSERADLKAHLLETDKRTRNYMALEARLISKFGPAAGVFLRQIIFWTGKGATPEGWIYKKAAEMHRETGLWPHQQRAARKVLKARGVLEEHRRSRREPFYYRVKFRPLMDILDARESDEEDELFGDTFGVPDFDDPDDPLVLENEYEPLRHHTQPEGLRDHTQSEHQGVLTESEGLRVPTTENTPQSTAIENERESALQAALSRAARGFAPMRTEEILKNTSTSPLPRQRDVEPDSAKGESTSDAPPLSPEVERDLAGRVRKIVVAEPNLKDAALKAYRAGRVEDITVYVTGELGDLGEEVAAPEHVSAVLPGVLAELEAEV